MKINKWNEDVTKGDDIKNFSTFGAHEERQRFFKLCEKKLVNLSVS